MTTLTLETAEERELWMSAYVAAAHDTDRAWEDCAEVADAAVRAYRERCSPAPSGPRCCVVCQEPERPDEPAFAPCSACGLDPVCSYCIDDHACAPGASEPARDRVAELLEHAEPERDRPGPHARWCDMDDLNLAAHVRAIAVELGRDHAAYGFLFEAVARLRQMPTLKRDTVRLDALTRAVEDEIGPFTDGACAVDVKRLRAALDAAKGDA